MRMTFAAALVVLSSVVLSSVAAFAQTTVTTQTSRGMKIDSVIMPAADEKQLTTFWTAERLRDAEPMATPTINPKKAK